MKQRIIRFTAKVMICVMAYQLIIPATKVMALTSGPTQPEVQSFEPVGTTDMVDIFSGDFNYNIPLMDVEGYPINIAYHSGGTIEDEASWVGLGWNINPGEINRGVRGVPDDFNGDTISKKMNILAENDYRLRSGINVGAEFLGTLNVGLGAGQYVSYNNYKGMGVGFDANVSLSVPYVSTGMGMAVGSLEGADVDVNAGLTFKSSKSESSYTGSISISGSTGFNTRTGLKNLSYGVSAELNHNKNTKDNGSGKNIQTSQGGMGFGSSIPIGMQNYVAAVTNKSTMNAWQVQIKGGLEAMYAYGYLTATMTKSTLQYDQNGSMPSYGYLHAQDGTDKGIMDFTREKDGVYNNTMTNLPLSSMTYDIYSITAQGTGGMFRPFRNDVGSVYDPVLESSSSNTSLSMEFGAGIGLGGLFEFGTDFGLYKSRIASGPWFRKNFRDNAAQSFFENTYFKQAGEMTYSQVQEIPEVANHNPFYVTDNQNMYNKNGTYLRRVPSYYGSLSNRTPRANHLSYITNDEASTQDVTFNTKIENYPNNGFIDNNATIKYKARTGTTKDKAKGHHIGEMTQVLPDGRRYTYGLPVMNNVQREATFSVNNANANITSGLVTYASGTDDRTGNIQGRDHFYQGVYTPAFAHSYLLTSVLSTDYTDVTGDGITEDDLGSYTKFNYTMVDSDYRWITPYPGATTKQAQYNPGFWSDPDDDKGNIISGSKELWYLHSVETKNYVAEFYTSRRLDGRGVKDSITNSFDVAGYNSIYKQLKTDSSRYYKLDSIKLYNKHDRFINKANATPIKTVIFTYDYSLCPGVPNKYTTTDGTGKLTLKRIYFKYGKSQKSLVNPYVFNYSAVNKPYSFADKDRWGNYKTSDPTITNYEYPYVNQNRAQADSNASTWQLTEIVLPSGGHINVKYEADDYSFVQDQRTMEMFRIAGVGGSSTYDPRDILYENEDQAYNYIYFKRDKTREITGRTMKQNYLENQDMLYFSFNVDIAARNRFEYIKGYAKVEDVGYCNNDSNSDYGYIKVKREKAGGKSDKMLNPVTLAGLNTGRYYLPHIIYPGYGGGPGDFEVLNGLVAATRSLLTITENANIRFVKDGLAKRFKPAKSWVRLHTPGYTKLGGGSRVKTLTLTDSWDKMVPGGTDADYGRAYDYTTLLDNTTKISSGVASYEPLVGGDENPLRQPVKYTAESGRLLPAIDFYQEEPFGESFYPGPSVGYSKVAVRSIHKDEGRSSKAEDVYEFYTAKDFPVETEFTPKQTQYAERQHSLTNKFERNAVVQGYVLRMNDMHGKAKSISNYVIKENTSGDEYRELITSTKYNYQVDGNGRLNNTVKAVKRGDLINPTYSITDLVLGEEVDFTLDNRERDMESQSINVSFNLNVVNFAFVVIPIPTIFFPDQNERSIFQTMVATKVIQQYGVLKSVEVSDHGARTVMENVLYDSETGQVLLTKTNNEFNDPITNISYPAYWAYDRMGPSYYNIGYEEVADTMLISNGGKAYLGGLSNKNYFNEGDELLLRFQSGGATVNYKVWVTGMENAFYSYPDTCWRADTSSDGGICYPDSSATNHFRIISTKYIGLPCALTLEPRAKYSTGYSTSPWLMDNTLIKDVYVKVIRSGRRNQLASSVQSVALAGAFNPTTFSDLFTASIFGSPTTAGQSSVIAATARTYTEDGVNNEFTSSGLGGTFGFNKFIRGERGNFREDASYSWMGPRRYTSNHARKDGIYDIYKNLWLSGTPTVYGCGTLDQAVIITSPLTNWKLIKDVVAYNSYGLPKEEVDAAGIYSSALYGYNYSLPVAVASNARYGTVKYFGFEDLLELHQDNKTKLGIWNAIKPTSNPTTYINTYGKKYGIMTAGLFGTNTSIVTEAAHTGNYSMKTTGAATLALGPNTDYTGVDYAYVSIWVKPVTAGVIPSTGSFKLNVTNGGSTTAYTIFSTKTHAIDGWYKLEGKIDLPATYTSMALALPTGYYVDDIRFYPDNGNMKSFAYDFNTFRLMAELDENNFATFYEYDQEGALIRVKKETEQGILTVNENRKANAKHAQ